MARSWCIAEIDNKGMEGSRAREGATARSWGIVEIADRGSFDWSLGRVTGSEQEVDWAQGCGRQSYLFPKGSIGAVRPVHWGVF